MKYKVGDKVIVRKDIEENNVYSGYFLTPEMAKFRGLRVTIRYASFDSYSIEEGIGDPWWTDEMFEEELVILPQKEAFIEFLKKGREI